MVQCARSGGNAASLFPKQRDSRPSGGRAARRNLRWGAALLRCVLPALVLLGAARLNAADIDYNSQPIPDGAYQSIYSFDPVANEYVLTLLLDGGTVILGEYARFFIFDENNANVDRDGLSVDLQGDGALFFGGTFDRDDPVAPGFGIPEEWLLTREKTFHVGRDLDFHLGGPGLRGEDGDAGGGSFGDGSEGGDGGDGGYGTFTSETMAIATFDGRLYLGGDGGAGGRAGDGRLGGDGAVGGAGGKGGEGTLGILGDYTKMEFNAVSVGGWGGDGGRGGDGGDVWGDGGGGGGGGDGGDGNVDIEVLARFRALLQIGGQGGVGGAGGGGPDGRESEGAGADGGGGGAGGDGVLTMETPTATSINDLNVGGDGGRGGQGGAGSGFGDNSSGPGGDGGDGGDGTVASRGRETYMGTVRIGGAGGDAGEGGNAIASSILFMGAVGGDGGRGGRGGVGSYEITESGASVSFAAGLSIGGDGGRGGSAGRGGVSGQGGTGGDGGDGGEGTFDGYGEFLFNELSIGGSGGNGADGGMSLVPPALNDAGSGGGAGAGGAGGEGRLTHTEGAVTINDGFFFDGIVRVGGAGGDGGDGGVGGHAQHAVSIGDDYKDGQDGVGGAGGAGGEGEVSLMLPSTFASELIIGGDGGNAGHGTRNDNQTSDADTTENNSRTAAAGGDGGFGRLELHSDTFSMETHDYLFNGRVGIGGAGGDGGDASDSLRAFFDLEQLIVYRGRYAGGDGGAGGDGAGAWVELVDNVAFADEVAFGGGGGAGGSGGVGYEDLPGGVGGAGGDGGKSDSGDSTGVHVISKANSVVVFEKAATFGGDGGAGGAGGDAKYFDADIYDDGDHEARIAGQGGAGGDGGAVAVEVSGELTFAAGLTAGGDGGRGGAGGGADRSPDSDAVTVGDGGDGGKGGDALLAVHEGGTLSLGGTVLLGGVGGKGGSGGMKSLTESGTDGADGRDGNGRIFVDENGELVLLTDAAVTLRGEAGEVKLEKDSTFTVHVGTTLSAHTFTDEGAQMVFNMDDALWGEQTTNLSFTDISVADQTTIIGEAGTTIYLETLHGLGALGNEEKTYTLIHSQPTSAVELAGDADVEYMPGSDTSKDRRFTSGLTLERTISEFDDEYLHVIVSPMGKAILTWTNAEGNHLWSNFVDENSPHNWTGPTVNGKSVTQFLNGDDVIFGDTPNGWVAVDKEGVTAESMEVKGDYLFTGGVITVTGSVFVDPGKTLGLAAGGARASLVAGAVAFDGDEGSRLAIVGYRPEETEELSRGEHYMLMIRTESGIYHFDELTVTVDGQPDKNSFLVANAFLENGINDLWVRTFLRWYSTDLDRRANGTFDLAGAFDLGVVLEDNDDPDNRESGWDGKTLTKTGDGTLTLSAANTYTGDTIIEKGALIVTGLLGAAPSGANYAGGIRNDGVLRFEQEDNQTISGVISGDGQLEKAGTGTLTLTGDNAYEGLTTVLEGTLIIGDGGAKGSLTGDLDTAASVVFDRSDDTAYAGTLTGTGSVAKKGAGVLTLTDFSGFEGSYAVSTGTLQLRTDGGYAFANALTGPDAATLAFDLGGAAHALTFGASVGDGFSGVVELRSGTLNLNGANVQNVFTNATLMLTGPDGIATLSADQTLKNLAFNGGVLLVDNAGHIDSPTLTVADLSVSAAAGGRVGVDIDDGIDTDIADYGSFYDYATSAEAGQKAVVLATESVTGDGRQLAVTSYDGTPLPLSPVVRNIEDGGETVGTATFDYLASVLDTDDKKGVYLGYGLIELKADSGQMVVLDSGDSASADPTLNAKLTGDGGFVFKGAQAVAVGNADSDYTGVTRINAASVTMLTDNAFGATSRLTLLDDAFVDMDGKSQTVGGLTGGAGTGIALGSLTVDQNTAGTVFAGVLSDSASGPGTLTKQGDHTLTLAGENTHGRTVVSGGALALIGRGSIADSSLFLAASATFDISGITAANTTLAGLDAAKGSVLATGPGDKLLVLTDTPLSFDLANVEAGETILAVTGGGHVELDADTAIALTNAVTPSLKRNDTFVLIDRAAGTVTGQALELDWWKFTFEIVDGSLLARAAGILSFVEATNDYLGPLAPGNINIRNGGAYLDWLLVQPFGETPGMAALEDYFTDIIGILPPAQGARELERFYGAYSAYRNRALADDANRFSRRWRRQNHFFLDSRIFADFHAGLSAAAGLASDSGLASPVYGLRQCVPVGQSRIWAGGFGTWSDQDRRHDVSGYKYESYGLSLGYEHARDRLKLGVAAAYSRGELKVKGLGYKNKPDVFNVALYAVYLHESGFYAEGGIGYGHAWNDYDVHMQLGGKKSGDYGSDVFSADLELGYVARVGCGFNLIPSVGLEYDYLRNDSWTEKVSGHPVLTPSRFGSGHDHSLDIPIGLRVNRAFRFGADGFVIPELRASYAYSANRSRSSIESGFAGAPGGATMRGVDLGRSHWRFGAGVSGRVNRRVDFQVEYEYDTRSGFDGHSVNANLGVSF